MSAPVLLYLIVFFAAYGLFEFAYLIVVNFILRNHGGYGKIRYKHKIGKSENEQ